MHSVAPAQLGVRCSEKDPLFGCGNLWFSFVLSLFFFLLRNLSEFSFHFWKENVSSRINFGSSNLKIEKKISASIQCDLTKPIEEKKKSNLRFWSENRKKCKVLTGKKKFMWLKNRVRLLEKSNQSTVSKTSRLKVETKQGEKKSLFKRKRVENVFIAGRGSCCEGIYNYSTSTLLVPCPPAVGRSVHCVGSLARFAPWVYTKNDDDEEPKSTRRRGGENTNQSSRVVRPSKRRRKRKRKRASTLLRPSGEKIEEVCGK